MKSKRIGLYFGTFNPIHVGHLIIADYMAQNESLDEVWLVITPQNPLKQKSGMLSDTHRLYLVRLAIEGNPRLKASNIEFGLPKPSFTVHTLAVLGEKYPQHSFVLIMGQDNLRTIHKWKNFETILQNHDLLVYPRSLTVDREDDDPVHVDMTRVKLCPAPVMAISSTEIRKAIEENKEVKYLLTPAVEQYVSEMNFYRK